jgi:hypothetical protein
MKKATQIFNSGLLSFTGEVLASSVEYGLADRCIGSIFEALEAKELVELSDGQFIIDESLDLSLKFVGYSKYGHESWQDLVSGEIKSSWDLVV